MKSVSEASSKTPAEGTCLRVFDDEVRYLFGAAALAKLVKRSLVVLELIDAQFLTNGAREIDEGRTMGTDVNDGIASVKRRIQDLPLSRGDTIVFDLRLQPDGGDPTRSKAANSRRLGSGLMKVSARSFNIAAVNENVAVRDGDVIGVTQDMMVDHEIGAGNCRCPKSPCVPRRRIPRTVE